MFKSQTLTFQFSTYRPNSFKHLSRHTQSDRMRETTAVIVASVVETTRDQVIPRQQHFVDHEQTSLQERIAGLVKHLSPYTGRIPD